MYINCLVWFLKHNKCSINGKYVHTSYQILSTAIVFCVEGPQLHIIPEF